MMDHGDDPGQTLIQRPLGKVLTSEHPRVEYLNGFPRGPAPSRCPTHRAPDYPPFSWHPDASRADQDRKLSNRRLLPEMCEDLARIVAMVLPSTTDTFVLFSPH